MDNEETEKLFKGSRSTIEADRIVREVGRGICRRVGYR